MIKSEKNCLDITCLYIKYICKINVVLTQSNTNSCKELHGNRDCGNSAVTRGDGEEVCGITAGTGMTHSVTMGREMTDCGNTAGICPYNHLKINFILFG